MHRLVLSCGHDLSAEERREVEAQAIDYWMRCMAHGYNDRLKQAAKAKKKTKAWISRRMYQMTAVCFWVSAKVHAVDPPKLTAMADLAFNASDPTWDHCDYISTCKYKECSCVSLFDNEEDVKKKERKLLGKILNYENLTSVFLPPLPKRIRDDPTSLRKLLQALADTSKDMLVAANHYDRAAAVREVYNSIHSKISDQKGSELAEMLKDNLERHLTFRSKSMLARRFPRVPADPRVELFLKCRTSA